MTLSMLIYSLSSTKTIPDSDRIRRYASAFPESMRKAYSFIGNWVNWLSNAILSLSPTASNPTYLSFAGLLSLMVASISIATQLTSVGGILIIIGGMMDILDGKTARKLNKVSRSGAFADSVIDRIGEIFVFLSLCFLLLQKGYEISCIATSAAMGFSMLVSYIRARGESLGVHSEEGIMRRQERIFLLSSGLMLDSLFKIFTKELIFTQIAVYAILIGSAYTSAQRFRALHKILSSKDGTDR